LSYSPAIALLRSTGIAETARAIFVDCNGNRL